MTWLGLIAACLVGAIAWKGRAARDRFDDFRDRYRSDDDE